MGKIILLSELFENLDYFPWNHALYLSRGTIWNPMTDCAVLDPEDSDDPDDDPILAKENNLQYVLIIQDVQSIAENAKLQLGLVNINQFIRALKYYFDNDAYINFAEPSN